MARRRKKSFPIKSLGASRASVIDRIVIQQPEITPREILVSKSDLSLAPANREEGEGKLRRGRTDSSRRHFGS